MMLRTTTALDMLEATTMYVREDQQRLSLGCQSIDKVLRSFGAVELWGGIFRGGVTEIYGEAASGKTQTVLRLLMMGVLSPDRSMLVGKTVYVCTEGNAPTKRLANMVDAWLKNSGCCGGAVFEPQFIADDVLERVLVEEVQELQDLYDMITIRLPKMLALFGKQRDTRIRVVVIDSVAAIFRTALNGVNLDNLLKRANILFQLASKMRELSDRYDVCFVVVNQVSANFSHNDVQAALGLTWSNCINSRIMLKKTGDQRKLSVVFSPVHGDQTSVTYRILTAGICAGSCV